MKLPKGNKYRSIAREIDGIKFPSKKEARRYSELKLLERAGKITDLKVHQRFSIDINGQHVCDYVADFVYNVTKTAEDPQHGHILIVSIDTVVEDVKGFKTDVYKLKRRLMKAVRGIEIKEV